MASACINCHRWLVLAASFCTCVIVFGDNLSMGVFFLPLVDTFKMSRSITAAVHSTLRGITGIFGIVSGLITAKLGIGRTSFLGGLMLSLGFMTSFFATSVPSLCVTIGVVGGIGSSLLANACTTATGQSFSGPMRGFALGLQNSSVNVGGMVFPILVNFLLTQFGLHGAFLVLGGISMHTVAAGLWFSLDGHTTRKQDEPSTPTSSSTEDAYKKRLSTSTSKNDKRSKYDFLEWITIPIVLVIIGAGTAFGSIISFVAFVVDVFVWKGASRDDGVTCITIINTSALVSRLLPSLIKRFLPDSWTLVPSVVFCVLGTVGICLISVTNLRAVMIVGAVLIGLPVGDAQVSGMAFIMDNVSFQYISVGTGAFYTWTGVAAVTTAQLFGAVYDWTSSYQIVLIAVGCLQIFCCVLFLTAMIVHHYRQSKDPEHPMALHDDVNSGLLHKPTVDI